jgi:hypothetical protein
MYLTFQIFNAVVDNFYLLFNHWHTPREVVMLRNPSLKLL